MAFDLLLSSGFLAFARQCGFLTAVEDAGLPVDGVFGTSSGALAGALWAAGMPARDIADELSAATPLSQVGWHAGVWRGLFTLDPVIARLRTLLPASFGALARPLGVGVRGPTGDQRWLTEGDLPAAVAASCAMPWVFRAVSVDGVLCQDGGAVDRLGYGGWRTMRGPRPVVVHRVRRSAGVDGEDDLDGLPVVTTPRSGASFFSLGDFEGQLEEARGLAAAVLAPLVTSAGT